MLPPLDWWLRDEPTLAAVRQARPDGAAGSALTLIGSDGRGGEAAHQLLLLAPGTYRLTGLAGGAQAAADWPIISLECAEGAPPILHEKLSGDSKPAVRFSYDVVVPRERCAGQWLRLAIDAADDNTEVWVDELSVAQR